MSTKSAASSIMQKLSVPEKPAAHPVLVLLSGLPGTGKSTFGRQLAEAVGAIVIQTDFVRRTLYPQPTYAPAESYFVYRVSHDLISTLLAEKHRVIFDATNLDESNRRQLYRIAEKAQARLVIVQTTAPETIIRQRLARRQQTPSPQDLSEADWDVYRHMKHSQQAIRRPHFTVNTSRDIAPCLAKVVHAIVGPNA